MSVEEGKEKVIDELLKDVSPAQARELIKYVSRKSIEKIENPSLLTPQENFLLNPQDEGLWTVSFSVRKNEKNVGLFQRIEWEDDRYYRYYRYQGSDTLFEKLLNFLFKLLPEKQRSSMLDEEFTLRRIRGFPFHISDNSRVAERTRIQKKRAKLPTEEKKKLLKQHKLAFEEYKKNLRNFLAYPSHTSEDYGNLIDHKTGQIIRFQRNYEGYTLISLNKQILQSLICVLEDLHVIQSKTYAITKLLRPEQELMNHYVHIFGAYDWKSILQNPNVIESVRLSLEEFENNRYSYSIRSSGLAMEEILVDIYEIFLRRTAPQGDQATLTHLIQNIMKETKELIHSQQIGPIKKEKEDGFDKINQIIENSKDEKIEELGKLMRQTMQKVTEVQKTNGIKTYQVEQILFPKKVLESIQETTKLRNDVSHRRQGEIGMFEAAKALKGVYLLSKWWNNEKTLIDWDMSKEEILSAALERNTNEESSEKTKQKQFQN